MVSKMSKYKYINQIDQIVLEIIAKKYEDDYISPNLVADVAERLGFSLSSTEIVFISDNITELKKDVQ